MDLLLVGAGGALGAALRYAVSLIPLKSGFPYLTLAVNLLGAVVIGFIVGAADKSKCISDRLMLFLKTGFCGGFTTFSTFSLEALELYESGKAFSAVLYAFVSVILCVLGVFSGKLLSKTL